MYIQSLNEERYLHARTAAQRDGALEELLPTVWIRPAT